MSDKVIKTIGSSKPIRMWIDGKCFNLRHYKGTKVVHTGSVECSSERNEAYHENDEMVPDNGIGSDITFITDNSGKLCTGFELPSLYYIKLHQKDLLDLNSVSKRTNTNITVPKLSQEGKLMICGDTKFNIIEAINEIYSAVGQIRDRNVALQFISIPLLSNEIQTNFKKFKNEILSEEDLYGIEDSIFQSHLKLHLTINVMVLLDSREKNEAIKALEDCNTTIMKPLLDVTGPLKIQVSGIECMNNNYEKVDVLYAKAKFLNETEDITLQRVSNAISDFFYERGLLKRHQENVKLHMTLMNSKYRKDLNSPKKKWTKRKSFDARKIMEKYKNFEFGQCNFNCIHLSKISSKGEDGFYEPLSYINI
nr:activating signal cointegrator 1 complex subunit 1-like [Leptinotarsa decemlineata]